MAKMDSDKTLIKDQQSLKDSGSNTPSKAHGSLDDEISEIQKLS